LIVAIEKMHWKD